MIAVFLYIWRVTMLQCYSVTLLHLCKKISKALQHFKKVLHLLKKSEGAFCNTPSLEYQIMK